MKKLVLSLVSLVLVLSLVGVVSAATWTVDDSGGADYTTIQAAISAASSGDTINVAAGTYVEKLNLLGKSLTIIGEDVDKELFEQKVKGIKFVEVVKVHKKLPKLLVAKKCSFVKKIIVIEDDIEEM